MIILIPSILGGLWQILELSSIGTAYIRFFSVSQVIPDGLLFLFLLLVLYISFNLGVKLPKLDLSGKIERALNVMDNSEEKNRKNLEGPVNEVNWGLFFTMIIPSGLAVLYIIRYTLIPESNSKNLTVSNAFVAIFFISVYLGMIKSMFPINKFVNLLGSFKLDGERTKRKEKIIDYLVKLILLVLLIFSFYIAIRIISIIIELRNGIMDFGNFIDTNQFGTLVNHAERELQINRILYSNDKYAIIEMIDSNQNFSIKVYPIQSLFK